MIKIRQRMVRRALWAIGFGLAVVAGPSAAAQGSSDATGPNELRIALLQAKPRAYAVVESTSASDRPRVRLAGLEAVQYAPDAAVDLARAGLVDENPAVRFGALVTIGKLKLDNLADAAIDLMRDKNPSVRAAAIFAAKRCGRDVDLSPLGRMLASGDPSARANAAMLVGQLGDPQAMPMLREMAAEPMPRVTTAQRAWVRLQFAEAMIRLDPDDPDVLGSIRAAVFSDLDDVRILAIQVLGEINDRSVQGGLAHLLKGENPIQVKIAAAQSLAQMDNTRGVATLMEATEYDSRELRKELERYVRDNGGPTSPQAQAVRDLLADERLRERAAAEVRAQAAIALTWVKSAAAVKRLGEMLDDPDPIVRVAAATAVLQASR